MDGADDRWRRADELFAAALDLDDGERADFLARECAGEPQLERDVSLLLRLATSAAGLPGRTAIDALIGDGGAEDVPLGSSVGSFRLVSELGRGGMAVVYLAERTGGEFEQRVAVKIMHAGGGGATGMPLRFARERQILARTSHPNIARLIDGGSTPDGRPYFVMEYVAGRPIDVHCDALRLSVAARLDLFRQVAEAVAYAHRNLIVHGDIKPSNILVTADGVVKLLDFGLARVFEPGEAGELTIAGCRFMTPAWASPEQIEGAPLTPAADVYQLGLLLFTLLTGRAPYATDTSDPQRLRRAISEEAPSRPSLVVTRPRADAAAPTPEALGVLRRSSPAALRRQLAGDLDNIVLMALRKEPDRRYPSAAELADDIGRFAGNLPVRARPDTWSYRSAKFVRRHRVAVVAAGIIAASLVASSVVATLQARRVAAERDRAERVVSILIDLFESSNPTMDPDGGSLLVRDFLRDSEERILRQVEADPETSARLRDVLGQVYNVRGEYPRAEALLEQALDQQTALTGLVDPTAAAMFHRLAFVRSQTLGPAAEPMLRESLELQRRVHGARSVEEAQALHDLAAVLTDPAERGEMITAALDIRRERLPAVHRDIASGLNQLAIHHFQAQRVAEAARYFEEALAMMRELRMEANPHYLTVLQNLATTYTHLGDLDRAEELLITAVERRRELLGDRSPDLATSLNNLCSVYGAKREYARAREILAEAISIYRDAYGPSHVFVANALRNMAMLAMFEGRYEEALQSIDEAIASQRGFDLEDTATVAHLEVQRASILLDLGRMDEARRSLERWHDVLERLTPDGGRELADAKVALARVELAGSNPERAEPLLRDALAFRESNLGPDHGWTAEARAGLGLALAGQGRTAEAEPLLRASAAIYRDFGYGDPVFRQRIERGLAAFDR
jgi:serine/threonine-protein kinase